MEDEIEEELEEFLHSNEVLEELRKLSSEGKKSLIMNYDRLVERDTELAKTLLNEPLAFLEKADEIIEDITEIPNSHLRIKGLDETVDVRGVRAEDVGKFIQLEGILTRASDVKPEIKIATFICQRCGEENRVLQTGKDFQKPQLCQNPNCGKKGPFRLEEQNSEFRDWQSLRVQELPEALRGGRVPRHLSAIVRDDMVDEGVPGNQVVVTGVLRAYQESENNKKKTTFKKVLQVNHISVKEKSVEETELSEEDEEWIEDLKEDNRVRNLVVNSIAPSIFGYDKIKEAIALQLFGSPAVDLPDESRIRGDSHILLTGDPGTAKSQLLKWANKVAPRGIYTSGKKATGAGLTAAAVRDELTGGWTLEAGALAIGDGGIACIDEFDKMSDEESGAILESMEQQTISVAKAGIVATLNTRTAILAAANPRLGRFDQYDPIPEQIDLPALILSRFDLIFILRDIPKEEKDRDLADHMLNLQSRPEEVVEPELDREELRKLIIYAKKYIHPKFENEEAKKKLEDFFVQWRTAIGGETGSEEGAVPITARQLEALVRLAKSNARLRLSEEVTVEDAERAIELFRESLRQLGIEDESGKPDIDILMTGHDRTQHDKLQRIMKIIDELTEDFEGDRAPINMVKDEAKSDGIDSDFVEEMIRQEKKNGRLYSPSEGMIKKATG